ncbi:MAG: TrkH family potassium uptake protein [Eubacteriaceae bacterium]|nr:TrkH family potassium uptake protein [Eubacteriaceae bacterium]
MNKRMIIYITGILMIIEAVLMLPSVAISLMDADGLLSSFLISIGLTAGAGGLLAYLARPKSTTIYARDGLVTVAVGWIVLSLMGALPFWISHQIPSYVDAFFETASGFTTTGASILTDVEALSRSVLFWRSFTHWIGGMGVLVFIMAVIPLASGGGNIHLMKAESPGFEASKLVPRTGSTAKILYLIYLGMTVTLVVLLRVGGMDLFSALCLSFGTAGTGGFGVLNDSIASYSTYSKVVITLFMTLFGVNFSFYYLILRGKFREALKNEEVRWYLIIYTAFSLIITFSIIDNYNGFGSAMLDSFFQVSSVMTTTGYSTANFDLWPELAKALMVLAMCIGACAGSTGGGFKVSRVIVLFKYACVTVQDALFPNRVHRVKLNGRNIDDSLLRSIGGYFALYMLILLISCVVIASDGYDFTTNVTAVVATLNNIGPGLNAVGAAGNYSGYSAFSKLVLCFDMIAGRLELLPMMVLFSRRLWK